MGFPTWFHLLVSLLELLSAALLVVPGCRSYGLALAATTMLGAVTVLIRNGEGGHAAVPGLVLLLIAAATLGI